MSCGRTFLRQQLTTTRRNSCSTTRWCWRSTNGTGTTVGAPLVSRGSEGLSWSVLTEHCRFNLFEDFLVLFAVNEGRQVLMFWSSSWHTHTHTFTQWFSPLFHTSQLISAACRHTQRSADLRSALCLCVKLILHTNGAAVESTLTQQHRLTRLMRCLSAASC